MHPLPSRCPRCGAPLYFAQEVAPPTPRRRTNYAFLRHSPTASIIVLCVLAYIVEVIFARNLNPSVPVLLRLGANWGPGVYSGQWWRLLTSVFLHGGLLHIATNMWALFNLGLLAEILYGRRNYVILYLLCGLGGSVASVWWHPEIVGVGASGAIFGIAGALLPALKFQRNPRIAAALRGSLSSIALFVIYNLAIGAAMPFIDNAAHIGGLVTGLSVGFFLPSYTVEEERRQTGRSATVFLLAFIVIVSVAIKGSARSAGAILLQKAEQAEGTGHKDEAAELYKQALAKSPNLELARYRLAALLLEQGKYEDSLPYWQRLNVDHPNIALWQESQCIALIHMGDAKGALDYCTKAAQLDKQSGDYQFNLGLVYRALERPTEAVTAFQKAYAAKPDGFEENYYLGLSLLDSGQRQEAILRLKRAVELNPEDESARLALMEAEKNK